MIRVLVVDDHQLFRLCLSALLKNTEGIEIVGEARDGFEAIEQTECLKPDVILMDIEMPRMDGLEATRQLVEKRVPSKILMLTMRTGQEQVFEAAQCGANGYLIKNASREELAHAIHGVYQGETTCSPEIQRYFTGAGR